MPRTRKQQPEQQPNAIVASAAKVVAGRRRGIPKTLASGWQDEAWNMLDLVGELEFYREWISNALSRCTLSVVEVMPDDTESPVTVGPAADALDALFGGDAGQAEMLASMGGHLAIPGETWLCGLLSPSPDPDGPDLWRVLSRDEVKEQGGTWIIDRGDGVEERYRAGSADDEAEVYMTRIWRPHPRRWVEAHSAVRSALPILRELVGYSKHDAAAIDSRLAGAGILAVPSEITFASPVRDGDDPTDASIDPFLAALIDAMMTAIEDRGDASALVPLVVRGPGEQLQNIKHITFNTPFDAQTEEKKQSALKRLANSLDVPAEVLLGLADVNHWTGWLLDENAIKMHIEPLLAVITGGLTSRFLWPCLQGDAQTFDPELRRYKIKGDTSALRQRPNRSAEAQTLHAALTITDAALARETGFEPDDLLDPTDPEFVRRVLVKLIQSGTPDVIVGALQSLGVTVDLPATGVPGGGEVAAPPVEPQAIEARRPVPEQASSILAVSEVMVARAVERAWNRAGKRGRDRKPLAGEDLTPLLAGAWEQAPRAAALTGVNEAALTVALDGYARELLLTGSAHDPSELAARIEGLCR